MPYNSRADVDRLLAEQYDTKVSIPASNILRV